VTLDDRPAHGWSLSVTVNSPAATAGELKAPDPVKFVPPLEEKVKLLPVMGRGWGKVSVMVPVTVQPPPAIL
jgi:hypothetical protein